MKHGKLLKKIGIISIIVGVTAIIISIICFIGIGIISFKVKELFGYRPTAEEIKNIISVAERALGLFGASLQDIAGYVGISAIELIIIKLFLALKNPALIIGLIALAVGFVLVFITKKPERVKKIEDSVAIGASTISGVVKTTIDNATVKCEKCGKTYVTGTKFCQHCGSNLEKESLTTKTQKCPVCQATILDKSKFCSKCGSMIDSEKKTVSVNEAPENAESSQNANGDDPEEK